MWDPKKIGRKGGAVASRAQRAAARVNGRKGGRPRKMPSFDAPRAEWVAYSAAFAVRNAERALQTAKEFPDIYPFTERQLRAILLRKGRRDLWLRMRRLPKPNKYVPPKTYEDYLEAASKMSGAVLTRKEWESVRRR